MTPEKLAAACDLPLRRAVVWAPLLSESIARWRIVRVPQWLAQCCHESAKFTVLEERLGYSAERLVQVWPRRFPRGLIDAQVYANKPELLANFVYANRMGNGSVASGDGWRYRGRGIKQITGRANYAAYARATGRPVLENPDLLVQDLRLAADSAGWFWADHQLDALTDVTAITRIVNGGLNGLDDRVAMTARAQQVLGEALA